jgi:hypothetical protein
MPGGDRVVNSFHINLEPASFFCIVKSARSSLTIPSDLHEKLHAHMRDSTESSSASSPTFFVGSLLDRQFTSSCVILFNHIGAGDVLLRRSFVLLNPHDLPS